MISIENIPQPHQLGRSVNGSGALVDNFGRRITYMRLSVTEFCNLRCVYCMPEHGVPHVPLSELLSLAELERLVRIAASIGITKIRITGGEPFVRKGLMGLLWSIKSTPGIRQLHITTNGTLIADKVPELQRMGVDGINLSLDSLDGGRFQRITRRDGLEAALETLHAALRCNIPIKLNAVVQSGYNVEDILPLARLTKDYACDVRFIEKMPFDGHTLNQELHWDYKKILSVLQSEFPSMIKLRDEESSTAKMFAIPGHKGKVGVIAGFSRIFCGSCNRIRVTAKGVMKTCLYDNGAADIKQLLRKDVDDEVIAAAIISAVGRRHQDGFAAQRAAREDRAAAVSMSLIGG